MLVGFYFFFFFLSSLSFMFFYLFLLDPLSLLIYVIINFFEFFELIEVVSGTFSETFFFSIDKLLVEEVNYAWRKALPHDLIHNADLFFCCSFL